jgi:hypothetical protein
MAEAFLRLSASDQMAAFGDGRMLRGPWKLALQRTLEMYVNVAYMMGDITGGDHARFPRFHARDR